MRRYIVGGNWKCNGSVEFANAFPAKLLKRLSFDANKVDVVVAPNFLHMF